MVNSRKREIRIKADMFREKCNISHYGIMNLFKECERCGYKLLRYPLGENSDLGFTVKRDQDIVIFTNTSSRLAREIFTLAHEIGHVLLHLDGQMSFVDDTDTISGKRCEEREQEANYFAACLLMPEDAISRFLDLEMEDFDGQGLTVMDIAKLMSEFNVSFETALNRLESLGKISSAEKIRLNNIKNQTKVGKLLKSVGGNGSLNEASHIIDLPQEYIDYVIYNYNHKAIPRETLERTLEYYQLDPEDISDKLIPEEEEEDLDTLIGGLTI